MDIEGDKVQVEGIENIFNKMIAESFPNLEKDLVIQVYEAFRTPNRILKQYQKRTSSSHTVVKTLNT
jgi:hypothetical protein